jgi:DNA-cytosine methyltransferase
MQSMSATLALGLNNAIRLVGRDGMAKTFTDLFAGCGGVARGLIDAGFEPCESVEFDPQIAEIHKANIGGKMYVMNILDCDPYRFEKVDLLHASTVCKAFSTANANKGEQQLDIDCAIKVAEFIKVLQPPTFTLENVQAYVKSKAFNIILEMLYSQGYWVNYQILNACDFGVPQSRRRLILVALKRNLISDSDIIQSGDIRLVKSSLEKGGLINTNQLALFDTPKSLLFEFDRIPSSDNESLKYLLKRGFYVSKQNNKLIAIHGGNVPSLPPKEKHIGWYEAIKDKVHDLPDSQLAEWQLKALPSEIREHCFYSYKSETMGNADLTPMLKPSTTLLASKCAKNGIDGYKAILIESTGARSDRELQTREANEPCWTLRAMGHDRHYHRANALLENAKTKALDIACLAALQSFPPDYIWSGVKSVDGKGIGNSVPPLMMEKIARSVLL